MVRKRRHKHLAFLFVFLLSLEAHSSDTTLSAKLGTYGFEVTSANVNESISGIGAYSLEVGHKILDEFMVTTSFNVLVSEFVTGSLGYGFDLGFKYYPFTSPTYHSATSDSVEVTVTEVWRPYAGLSFRQRQFLLILTTSYVGPGLFFGTDYQAWKNVFLNAEFRYDLLFGPNNAEATQMNILFGLGIHL